MTKYSAKDLFLQADQLQQRICSLMNTYYTEPDGTALREAAKKLEDALLLIQEACEPLSEAIDLERQSGPAEDLAGDKADYERRTI